MASETVWFEVSHAWLQACGFRQHASATAFPVLRTRDAGLLAFATLDMGDGRTFEVCTEWRGRFVNPPAAVNADPAYNAASYHGAPTPEPVAPKPVDASGVRALIARDKAGRAIATAGRFTIYKVTPTVWAIYNGSTFSHNARRTDAARYGVPFTNAGAQTYAESLERNAVEAAADRRTVRRAKVAAGRQRAAERAAVAAQSPSLFDALPHGGCPDCESTGVCEVHPFPERDADHTVAELESEGFTIRHTGGGCIAYARVNPNGKHVVVTALDGASAPAKGDWIVGVYADEEWQPETGTIICSDDEGAPSDVFSAMAYAQSLARVTVTGSRREGFNWSLDDGQTAYGTDFHATEDEARAAARPVLLDLAESLPL